MIAGQVAGMPVQVRQRRGEIHRVLAGAAADFQDLVRTGKLASQYRKDGVTVLFAGLGILFHA